MATTTTTTTAFPPHRTHSSHRIPPSQALALVTTYLDSATTDPSLHPNALLTENGPATAPGSGSNIGLVLHNLHRVQAGLRGEHLAADIPIKKSAAAAGGSGGGDGDSSDGFSGVITPGGNIYESDRPRRAAGDSTREGDWQDLGEFEREQEEDVRVDGPEGDDGRGAQGPDGQVVQGPVFGMEEEPKVNGYHHVDGEGIKGEQTVDRNARKMEKRERRKQAKREEQESRDRERNAQV